VTFVDEVIPEPLRPEVDAALAWFNRERQAEFEVTGIIDADESLAAGGPRELRLVLCGGELCEQRTFRVSRDLDGYSVALHDAPATGLPHTDAVPAELDPPPGARRSWLDTALKQHAFVVLVFYRGFW
jgi:hypothetical protein